jgi:hypothetical protein
MRANYALRSFVFPSSSHITISSHSVPPFHRDTHSGFTTGNISQSKPQNPRSLYAQLSRSLQSSSSRIDSNWENLIAVRCSPPEVAIITSIPSRVISSGIDNEAEAEPRHLDVPSHPSPVRVFIPSRFLVSIYLFPPIPLIHSLLLFIIFPLVIYSIPSRIIIHRR